MGDLKLFDIEKGVRKLKGSFVILEKSIQTLIEKNLEIFFGIRFLSSEYSTGNFKTGDGSLFDKKYKRFFRILYSRNRIQVNMKKENIKY